MDFPPFQPPLKLNPQLRPEQEKLLARLAPHSNTWLAVWGHLVELEPSGAPWHGESCGQPVNEFPEIFHAQISTVTVDVAVANIGVSCDWMMFAQCALSCQNQWKKKKRS